MGSNELIIIVGKKICTEVTKARIRRDFPPYIAEWKCHVIDMAERGEHIERLVAIMQPVEFGLNPSEG